MLTQTLERWTWLADAKDRIFACAQCSGPDATHCLKRLRCAEGVVMPRSAPPPPHAHPEMEQLQELSAPSLQTAAVHNVTDAELQGATAFHLWRLRLAGCMAAGSVRRRGAVRRALVRPVLLGLLALPRCVDAKAATCPQDSRPAAAVQEFERRCQHGSCSAAYVLWMPADGLLQR
ncbi:hypothetical protein JKP88DRAFT_273193 [Tribonema minus]|uniref:Uncharacterized protein n=1 Tax=Tribonema minus TaxID=303371 RepID=A0A835YYN0_9STRA|nr:hypothetical protein JKP88DRAFT_273193 [Tribonema minus]